MPWNRGSSSSARACCVVQTRFILQAKSLHEWGCAVHVGFGAGVCKFAAAKNPSLSCAPTKEQTGLGDGSLLRALGHRVAKT